MKTSRQNPTLSAGRGYALAALAGAIGLLMTGPAFAKTSAPAPVAATPAPATPPAATPAPNAESAPDNAQPEPNQPAPQADCVRPAEPPPPAPAKAPSALNDTDFIDQGVLEGTELLEGGLEVSGLTTDEMLSKFGHDLFDAFIKYWRPPENASYNLVFSELTDPFRGSLATVKLNDQVIFEGPLASREDAINELGKGLARDIRNLIRNTARLEDEEFPAAGAEDRGRRLQVQGPERPVQADRQQHAELFHRRHPGRDLHADQGAGGRRSPWSSASRCPTC
jgi:hypothetical protein